MSLKDQTVKGTLWGGLERFSVQGITFVVMVIMARILDPQDYGLVGMLAIFIAISQALVDSGFSQALIRKQNRTQTDNSTVFYFNIVVALVLYAILYVTAPLIAGFYRQPLLTDLTRVIGLSVVLNSLVVVQRALLTVKIDFKTQAKASITAAVISGTVGIVMAYTGFGVWAIAVQQLTSLSVNTLLLWIMSRWRPSWCYSWQSFREFFGFGSKLAVSGILDVVYNNLYLIVIGKVFNARDLGYYTRANQFANLPSSNMSGIIQRVTFPVLCTIQDEDERLAATYRRMLRVTAFIIFPLMLGLSAMARPTVLTLLGAKWAQAAPLLSILCLNMMWYPVHALNLNLLQVKGRSDLFLRLEVIKKGVGVALLCITIPMGLTAMCWGLVAYSLISLVINTHYTGRLIHVGLWVQMRDLAPVLIYSVTAAVMALAVMYFIPSQPLKLLAGIVTGLTSYAGIALLMHSPELGELRQLVLRKKH